MALDSMQEIFDAARAGGKRFWQVVQETDMEEREVTAEASFERMRSTWRAMLASVEDYEGDRRSVSGLVGGDGARMRDYTAAGDALCGPYLQEVIATALCVGESNACMRRIVAAPTAGACGVLPAVLVPLYQAGRAEEDALVQALYGQIGHAAAMALKNLMGLVCDPIAGLVEVPCVKRNVIGAVNAAACADMALAGIQSRVPVDEVIDCMGDVGRRLPAELRETALGGLAATPSGKSVKEWMQCHP